jgi:lysophospholipase
MEDHRGHLNQADIDWLRSELPDFEAAASIPNNPSAQLTRYLTFYQLPTASNDVQLISGKSADQQTLIMAWEPRVSQGTAIVVHGYMDHVGLYNHLIEHLLQQQLTVVCFDLIGHGLSSGDPGSINDFGQYVAQLEQVISLTKEHFPGPTHGIGQSMGGAILLKHLINQSDNQQYPFNSLNLLAPLLQPWAWKQSRRMYFLSRLFIKSIKRVFRPSSHDRDFLDFLRTRDPLQPRSVPLKWVGAMNNWVSEFERAPTNDFAINLIQGDNDKTLDWVHNLKAFQQKFSALSVTMVATGNHHLVNEKEDLRAQVFDSLKT